MTEEQDNEECNTVAWFDGTLWTRDSGNRSVELRECGEGLVLDINRVACDVESTPETVWSLNVVVQDSMETEGERVKVELWHADTGRKVTLIDSTIRGLLDPLVGLVEKAKNAPRLESPPSRSR